jgi:hypothetical protein
MTGWQPIETAPRDGVCILVFQAGWWRAAIAFWQEENPLTWPEGWVIPGGHCGEIEYCSPTHWQPLPEPPK